MKCVFETVVFFPFCHGFQILPIVSCPFYAVILFLFIVVGLIWCGSPKLGSTFVYVFVHFRI